MLKFFTLLAATAMLALGAEVGNSTAKPSDDKTPKNVAVGDTPDVAMKKMSVAPGLKIDVWASEPSLQNVVSFDFDEQGRCFVVESFRRRTSVPDIRSFRDWTESDLALRTVEERSAFLKANVSATNNYFMNSIAASSKGNVEDFNADGTVDWRDMEVEPERIRLLADLDGDFHADQSVLFATGFNSLVSGVAAGVLARNGTVYFTCIPDVWKITLEPLKTSKTIPDFTLPANPNRPGNEFTVERLHGGFGVHIAYGGHDMHGLLLGPDGKLYWTIADRGFGAPENIPGIGFSNAYLRRILPDTGAVYRCDPDGSNLEVVCVGLRNPQELAFDDHGNLFTVDNNADGGDTARVHYIVEGADYGWRYGWQHRPKLGAWNTEMLWGLSTNNTSLYQLHPIAHVTHGPAGLAYYPGTGLGERFNGHFFVADFPGGIRHFKPQADGAGFVIDNPDSYLMDNKPENPKGKLLWNLYPTDVAFSPDGGVYVLDWVFGWEKTGKGRIYRLHDPALANDPLIASTKTVLNSGMRQRTLEELIRFFDHPDQRVRLEAQWEAATRANSESDRVAIDILSKHAAGTGETRGRIHALWAIERSLATGRLFAEAILPLLKDNDAEIRAQAARAFRHLPATPAIVEILGGAMEDASPRVQFFAALSIARQHSVDAIPAITAALLRNGGRDAHLQHALTVALKESAGPESLYALSNAADDPTRLAALLAMRRHEMPEVAAHLRDVDPRIVREAARAIYDVPIPDALPALASFIGTDGTYSGNDPFVLRRAVHANFRLGKVENAQTLLAFTLNPDAPEALRIEAADALGSWMDTSSIDRVVGLARPYPVRDERSVALPFRVTLDELFKVSDATVLAELLRAAGRLQITEALPGVRRLAVDASSDVIVQVEALRTCAALKDPLLDDALKLARASKSERVRTEANRLLGNVDAATAVASLSETFLRGGIAEQQAALQTLAGIKGKEADSVIRNALGSLVEGKLRPELALDVLEAAARRTSPSIQERLKGYDAGRDPNDSLAPHRELLVGGDAATGRTIFYERAEAGCFRCHKVSGDGGEVGPELAGLATTRGREYVLESILHPNKHIATGYETLNVVMKSGQSYAGMKRGESETTLTLNSPEDGEIKLTKSEIDRSLPGMSAMPEGLGAMLTPREIRDLMEFLCVAPPPAKAK